MVACEVCEAGPEYASADSTHVMLGEIVEDRVGSASVAS